MEACKCALDSSWQGKSNLVMKEQKLSYSEGNIKGNVQKLNTNHLLMFSDSPFESVFGRVCSLFSFQKLRGEKNLVVILSLSYNV